MPVFKGQSKDILTEIITLSTPRGRVVFTSVASLIILAVPFQWLAGLSLWQRLGLDWAPSIGLTRAYWWLIHGRPHDAVTLNWLIIPVVGISVLLLAKDMRQIWTQGRKLVYTEAKAPN
jgi:hypothetical protein